MVSGKDSKAKTLDDIPALLETIQGDTGEESAAAIKSIYELCDVGHKQNRVPMVCSGKWDVLRPLAQCLTKESGDGRHLACLALNNLSIPTENKRKMSLGAAGKDIIGALTAVIKDDKQESYLCCICLMNLSFLEASIGTILQYSEGDGNFLEDPNSLIRVLEKVLSNTPNVHKAGTGKSEVCRWACGLIKNLSKSEENCKYLAQTTIPESVVANIKSSSNSPSQWTTNSLEDFSLFVTLNLAQWPDSKDAVVSQGAVDVISPIIGEGDLQGLKATMACAFLGAPWSCYPAGGEPAAQAIAELMSNVVEKKGKDGQYAYGVFKLYTATKAYRDLSAAAAKSSNEGVLAIPSAIALQFKILSDLVLAEGSEGGTKYVPDSMSAEYAAGTIQNLIPSIIKAAEPAKASPQTDKACKELEQMLNAYGDISGTSSSSKSSASDIASKMKGAIGSARPTLEQSYDLWIQLRKKEGQSMDEFVSKDDGIEADESGPLDFLPCAGGNSCVIC
mmetsp:Transcript_39830/g.58508  ORF Transcript_39830/g.58508 Transcript_39830/m.58508 type:complete len:505 (+) Transcript_39830:37-1551(+)|eukprot:CAMPEP_0195524932 /NCGR_PEP_ID=MMETSP0794_2-20130614/25059_1 /TAXON_ID=515487 /ORGANISM="Stephanopyxis turris, Strain CCMP 815" /LENGTH=504 /DNA_ID=CAMNT_0040655263 /DNA_START=13 /DNA_END=1527 /DNA_ORIENTATION=-